MTRKTFNFASFNPMLWNSASSSDPTTPVLEVQQLAPQGSPRSVLKTKLFLRQTTPHDAFSAFNGRHDIIKKLEAYAPREDDGTESDALQEQIYVSPSEFHAYQFRNNPTHLYITASDTIIRSILKRYRETTKDYSGTLSRRVVHINDLEKSLLEMEIVGYTLRNVLSETPITNLDVSGVRMDQNAEVQGAKGRAGSIASITFDLQNGQQIIRVRVTQNGSVAFADYPGDATALAVLDKLEAYINNASDMVSIQVRNSRSS